MPAIHTTGEALVLGRSEHGEAWWRLDLLTDHGVEIALFRRRNTAKAEAPPDWLDLILVELEHKDGGGAHFVRSFRLLRRCEGLGRAYDALAEAGRWAAWLRRHGAHLPEPGAIRALLGEALDAWARGGAPAAVGLKFGWRLARAEGWPVAEDWLARLGKAEAERAREVLRMPVAEISVPNGTIAALQSDLFNWIEEQVR